jgi:hypothetical protein
MVVRAYNLSYSEVDVGGARFNASLVKVIQTLSLKKENKGWQGDSSGSMSA